MPRSRIRCRDARFFVKTSFISLRAKDRQSAKSRDAARPTGAMQRKAAAAIVADLAASERCQARVVRAIVTLVDAVYSATAISDRIGRLSFLREHAVSRFLLCLVALLVSLPAAAHGFCIAMVADLVYCLEEINAAFCHALPMRCATETGIVNYLPSLHSQSSGCDSCLPPSRPRGEDNHLASIPPELAPEAGFRQ